MAPLHEIIVIPEYGQNDRRALQDQCYSVRIDVFHHEQGFPLDTEIDELDETATHFLLRLIPGREPIGTIRTSKAKGQRYYKLSRLAILKEYRQFRFGRELVQTLHDWVQKDAEGAGGHDGFVEIATHSQIPVKGFYAKFGYHSEGEEFDEDGAPHQKMIARLPLSA